MNKYEHAYTELLPGDSDFNVTLLRSMFTILRNQADDNDRHVELGDTINDWDNQYSVFLGLEIPSGELVCGQGLELVTDRRVQYSATDRDNFVDHVCRIALQHPTLALLPAEHEGNKTIAYTLISRWGHVKPEGGRHYIGVRHKRPIAVPFDPIANVNDLNEAITRAESLGLHGDEAIDFAWVVLVTNERALQRKKDPIDMIGTLFTDQGAQESLTRLYGRPGAIPDFDTLASLAARVLSPWRNEYLLATWNVHLADDGDGRKTLRVEAEPYPPAFGDVKEQSLWVYDHKRLPLLPNVLAAQCTPALVLTPEQVILHTPAPSNTVYGWLPVFRDRCVMRDANNRWIAVQTPSPYSLPRRLQPRHSEELPIYTA